MVFFTNDIKAEINRKMSCCTCFHCCRRRSCSGGRSAVFRQGGICTFDSPAQHVPGPSQHTSNPPQRNLKATSREPNATMPAPLATANPPPSQSSPAVLATMGKVKQRSKRAFRGERRASAERRPKHVCGERAFRVRVASERRAASETCVRRASV